MAESEDAHWLRNQIMENQDFVLKYDGQWIAVFQSEVVAAGQDVAEMIERFSGQIKEGQSPLFFFCYSGAFQ